MATPTEQKKTSIPNRQDSLKIIAKNNPALSQEVTKILGENTKPRNIENVFTPESLSETKPFDIQETPLVPDKVTKELATIESSTDQFVKDLEAQSLKSREAETASFEELLRGFSDTPGETELRARFEDQAGLNEIDKERIEINNQLREEQQSLRRQIEQIQSGAGIATADQRNAAVEEAKRVSYRKQADLYVIQQGIQGRYDSAKAIADRAIAIETERNNKKLDLLELDYQRNKDLFTKDEQRAFETKQADRERKLNQEEAKAKEISDLSIEALRNGAPSSVVSSMRGAKTPEEAIGIGGKYIGLLDRNLKNLQISKLMSESSSGGLSDKDRKAILSDKTAQQTTALIAADKVLLEYKKMIEEDTSPSPSRRKELDAYLSTVVGPTLAVASGQGAMTDDEREALMDDIGTSFWKREGTSIKAVESARKGFQTKIDVGLSSIDSVYPSASTEFGVFKEYNNDRLSESLGGIKDRASGLTDNQSELALQLADEYGVSVEEILMDNQIYSLIVKSR